MVAKDLSNEKLSSPRHKVYFETYNYQASLILLEGQWSL
ncbi:hypothetical protein D1AOALGA4SA_8074 [Olavius algarvensis Delta 1 endosymbiont]|nr:hypothetical protein D1AOALGA4SA_8074 [Olavius algarvensis Delta 1 endosymbiont]